MYKLGMKCKSMAWNIKMKEQGVTLWSVPDMADLSRKCNRAEQCKKGRKCKDRAWHARSRSQMLDQKFENATWSVRQWIRMQMCGPVYDNNYYLNTSWLPSFARAPPSLPASLSLSSSLPPSQNFLPLKHHTRMYQFSRQFMKFPELLTFWPLKLPPPPPRWGGG